MLGSPAGEIAVISCFWFLYAVCSGYLFLFELFLNIRPRGIFDGFLESLAGNALGLPFVCKFGDRQVAKLTRCDVLHIHISDISVAQETFLVQPWWLSLISRSRSIFVLKILLNADWFSHLILQIGQKCITKQFLFDLDR